MFILTASTDNRQTVDSQSIARNFSLKFPVAVNNGVYFLKITRLNIDVEKIERLYLMNSLPVCLIDERRVLYLEFPIKFPGSAYLLKMNILSLVPGNQKTFLIMKDTSHVKIPLQSWEEVVAWLDKTFAK